MTPSKSSSGRATTPQHRAAAAPAATAAGHWVNDVHSRLNRTRVARTVRPRFISALQATVRSARTNNETVSVAACRHAMGGQQFGEGATLIDTTGLDRVLWFDATHGLVEVEAGIQWPQLIEALACIQEGAERPWGIVQKQTGADRLSLGGALAANVHGRGLRFKPIVQDVDSFTLVDARGQLITCGRHENPELFGLAIGGYGLFGVIATVTLRLSSRQKLRRVVEMNDIESIMPAFERRIAQGCLYGDFQISTDPGSEGFLRAGILSCYQPVDPATPIPDGQTRLSDADWLELLTLGHVDKARAFDLYTGHYLSTSGQVYWSDSHQLSTYIDGYHERLDRRLGCAVPGSEMITEVYVPRAALGEFMAAVRRDFLAHEVDFIYGTLRLIERDSETFLAWAKEPYACMIFNLHVAHTAAGLAKAEADFRRLIDRAVALGGSYFLTYHRWASRAQVEACYPQFPEFLRRKRRHDPEERFQSTWYRHHKALFAGTGVTGQPQR